VTRRRRCAPIADSEVAIWTGWAAVPDLPRGVELHQSVHAVWKAHGVSRDLRSIWRRGKRRRWSCLTGWKREERGATFMKVRAGVAIFEAEAEARRCICFLRAARSRCTRGSSGGKRLGSVVLERLRAAGARGQRDHVAVFVVTAGDGVRERAEKAKHDGYYFKSHGCRRWRLKRRKAARSGCTGGSARIGDSPIGGDDHGAAVTSAYRGKRYSFGYPLARNWNTSGDWSLLRPKRSRAVDGRIHDGPGSEREARWCLQHPGCSYFSVGRGE